VDVFTELRGEERHERRAAIVNVRDGEVGRATCELGRVASRPFQQPLDRQVAVAVGRVENSVIFLESLNEPLPSTLALTVPIS